MNNKNKKRNALLIILFGLLFSGNNIALAQDDDTEGEIHSIANSFDFQLIGGSLGRLQPHGTDLMGDMIDKKTGGLSFQHTDVSIPGNSNLEVALRRKRSQGDPNHTPYQQGFGDWGIDIPIAYYSFGYNGARTQLPTFIGGCMTDFGNVTSGSINGVDFSYQMDGAILNIPGKGLSGFPSDPRELKANGKGLEDPQADFVSGGREEDFANNRCAQVVIGPDGTKYKFGRHVIRDQAKAALIPRTVVKSYPDRVDQIVERTSIPKYYAVLLLTEIEDIHGNWVNYQYTNDGSFELISISSNDGRRIDINYQSARKNNIINSRLISSVTVNSRTWRYEYGKNNAGTDLTLVRLPDGRTWDLDIDNNGIGMFAMRHEPYTQWDCVPESGSSFILSMKHPDGAVGTFSLRETRHIKSASTAGSTDDDSDHYMAQKNVGAPTRTNGNVCRGGSIEPGDLEPDGLPFYRAISLVQKTISGSDFTNAIWNFKYKGYTSGAFDDTWTEITEPDGTKRRYTYHAVGPDHGLMKSINVTSSNGTESYDYDYDLTQNVPDNCYSSGAFGDTTEACLLYAKRPARQTEQQRDGVTYRTVNTFNKSAGVFIDKGRPSTITRSSSLNWSKERKTSIDYWHSDRHASGANANLNFVGLPLRVYRHDGNTKKEFVSYSYNDANGLPRSVKKFGVTWDTFTYHSDGNLRTVTDPFGNTATLENYYRGQPRQITRRDGSLLKRTLDANGWVTSETDGNGNKINYGYNSVGWMTLVDRPSPWADTTMTYYNIGASNFYTNEKHGTSQKITWYDMMFRPTLERSNPTSRGGLTTYTKTQYDALGRTVFTSLPSSLPNPTNGTTTKYDGLGRVTETKENYGSKATSKTEYLSLNRVRVTDPENNKTTTTRSGFGSPDDGEPTRIQQPQSVNTAMNYDNFGNITTATQSGAGSSSTQFWSYDSRQRVCRHYASETGSKLYLYDSLDRVSFYGEGNTGTNGCVTSIPTANRVALSYDELGRTTVANYPTGTADVVTTYDNNGNPKTVNTGGANWTYTYNALNSVETETLKYVNKTFVLNPEYNTMGYMDQLTYPSGRTINYGLNGLGQTTSLGGYVTDVNYHSSGATDTITYGNGMTYTTELNDRLLPYDMEVENASGDKISDLRFTWDNNGNVKRIQDYVNAAYTITMGYDGLDRLTSANGYWGAGAITYDTLGNIKTKNLGTQRLTYNYDTRNRLDNVTGSNPYDFTYDARGNVKNNGDRGFNYNVKNLLTISDGIAYVYDANNKRIRKNVNGDISYSVYGQNGTLYYRQLPNGDHLDYLYVNGRLATTVESR